MTEDTTDELKPCPFCGGEAEIKRTGKLQITIQCKSCVVKKVQKVKRRSLDWLFWKMVEDWNTRIEPRALPDEARELLETMQRILNNGVAIHPCSVIHNDLGIVLSQLKDTEQEMTDG